MNFFERHGGKVLIAFFLIAYVAPLGLRPMMRPDEFRYAEIAREMIETGDHTVPHADGFRYFEKPVLGYQMIAASCKIFGLNRFAVRLPSALATGIAALALWLLMRKSMPEKRQTALWCVALHFSFALVWGVGTYAVLDPAFNAAVTLSITTIFLAWRERKKRRAFALFALAGAFAGIAFLIKGLLGLALPALVGGVFLLCKKEWKKLLFYSLCASLPAALIVLLPWSAAIHQLEPDFWRYFLVMEHWNRLTGHTYDRNPEPFWYFLPILLGGLLPGGLALFAAWKGWTKKFFAEPLHLFALLWFALPFLLFSASSCKLPTYILPCFPGIAILFACGMSETPDEKLLRIFRRIGGIVLILLGIGTVAVLILLRRELPFFAYAVALILLLWGVLTLIRGREVTLHFVAFALLLFAGSASLPGRKLGGAAAGLRIRECLAADPVQKSDLVLADKSMVLPVAWELRRADIIIAGRPGEMRYALEKYPAEYAGKQIDENRLGEFLRRKPRGNKVLFILRRRSKPLPADMPEPLSVVDTGSVRMLRY